MGFWDFIFKKPVEEVVIVIDGNDTIRKMDMRVMVLDGLDQSFVRSALKFVPSKYRLVMVPDNPNEYEIPFPGNPDWGTFPFPKEHSAKLMLVFNGTKRGTKMGGGAATWDPKRVAQCSVAIYQHESSPWLMGLRMWHELEHCFDRTVVEDQMNTNKGFEIWLPPNMRELFISTRQTSLYDPFWQTLYYTYLLTLEA